jgi:hypothetical protein
MSIDIQGYKIEACPACGILFDVKRVMDNYEYENENGAIYTEVTYYSDGNFYARVYCPVCSCEIETDVVIR